MSSDPIEVLREAVTALKTMHGPFDHDYIKDEMCCDRCRLLVRAESALASLSAPKGDLTVEELVEVLGGIVYWSGLDEVSIGIHSDAKVTGEVENAVALLNARMAPKPEGEWVLVPREPTPAMHDAGHAASLADGPMHPDFIDANRAIYAAMLAAAPKPPSMNDNAVAVNESAPVNSKPESAEAVTDEMVVRGIEAAFAATEKCCVITNEAMRAALQTVVTAPPRPEARAPVGVEGVIKAMRMLAGVGIPVKPECVGRWADQLEALAQQPAACDMGALCIGCEPRNADGSCPGQQPAAVDEAAVQWAVERWNDEVANRPLVNVHRRSLDDAWRQVIRHFGGDDVTLCGPRHDDLAGQQQGGTPE